MIHFANDGDPDHLVILCPRELDNEAIAEFTSGTKTRLLSSVSLYILDFRDTKKIQREFYPVLSQLRSILKRDGKNLISLHLSEPLRTQIHADGLEPVFNPQAKIPKPDAAKPEVPKTKLNVALLNPFLSAVIRTLDVQCKVLTKAGKPSIPTEAPDVAIAAVLPLASNGFNGTLVLGFPEKVFLKIYESMFDEVHTTITDEIQDAAGEILNIVYGLAKVELNNSGHTFEKAFPAVFVGERIRLRQSGRGPSVQIPFETPHGSFFVGIEIAPQGANGSHGTKGKVA